MTLKTKKEGKKTVYYGDGKKIKKSEYKQYSSGNWNLPKCKPCITKWYDANLILREEYVAYTDCKVGFYREYYPNGKLKISRYFKENPTGNWENIDERGFCSVADGEWSYYKSNGELKYKEIWENGKFIEQIPKQDKLEVHDIVIKLNDEIADSVKLVPADISNLTITPLFKSDNTDVEITMKVEISEIGHQMSEVEINLDNFNEIDVFSMLSKVGIPENEPFTIVFRFFLDGEFRITKWLEINSK